MVLITITTIGFSEVDVLSSEGRIITFLIIAGGLFVVQLTLQRFIQLSEIGYFIKLEELRLRRLIRRMKKPCSRWVMALGVVKNIWKA